MPADIELVGRVYSAHERLAVGFNAAALTAAEIVGRTHAFITCEDAPIRFRIDGSNPTAQVGHLLNVGDVLTLDRVDQLNSFRVIAHGYETAVLQCSYGR